MTEKDAVKLGGKLPDKYWYLPVDLQMDPQLAALLIEKVEAKLIKSRE
jgi:tetraacyldisaccharide-1-P 4'-kinase